MRGARSCPTQVPKKRQTLPRALGSGRLLGEHPRPVPLEPSPSGRGQGEGLRSARNGGRLRASQTLTPTLLSDCRRARGEREKGASGAVTCIPPASSRRERPIGEECGAPRGNPPPPGKGRERAFGPAALAAARARP